MRRSNRFISRRLRESARNSNNSSTSSSSSSGSSSTSSADKALWEYTHNLVSHISGINSGGSGKYIVNLSYINSIIEKLERARSKWGVSSNMLVRDRDNTLTQGASMKVRVLNSLRSDVNITVNEANRRRPTSAVSEITDLPNLTPDTVPITTLELSKLSSKIDEILSKCDHNPCNCNCHCDCKTNCAGTKC